MIPHSLTLSARDEPALPALGTETRISLGAIAQWQWGVSPWRTEMARWVDILAPSEDELKKLTEAELRNLAQQRYCRFCGRMAQQHMRRVRNLLGTACYQPEGNARAIMANLALSRYWRSRAYGKWLDHGVSRPAFYYGPRIDERR